MVGRTVTLRRIVPHPLHESGIGNVTRRTMPASMIEKIDYDPDDYELELRYKETTGPGEEEKWWLNPANVRRKILRL